MQQHDLNFTAQQSAKHPKVGYGFHVQAETIEEALATLVAHLTAIVDQAATQLKGLGKKAPAKGTAAPVKAPAEAKAAPAPKGKAKAPAAKKGAKGAAKTAVAGDSEEE